MPTKLCSIWLWCGDVQLDSTSRTKYSTYSTFCQCLLHFMYTDYGWFAQIISFSRVHWHTLEEDRGTRLCQWWQWFIIAFFYFQIFKMPFCAPIILALAVENICDGEDWQKSSPISWRLGGLGVVLLEWSGRLINRRMKSTLLKVM